MQYATSFVPSITVVTPANLNVWLVAASMPLQAPSFQIAFDVMQKDLSLLVQRIGDKTDAEAYLHVQAVYGPRITIRLLAESEATIDGINDDEFIADRKAARREARDAILKSMVIIAKAAM